MQTDFYKALNQDQREAEKHGILAIAGFKKMPMTIEVKDAEDRKKDIVKLLEKMIRRYTKQRIKSAAYGLKQIQQVYWKREMETRRIYNAVLREIELIKGHEKAIKEEEYRKEFENGEKQEKEEENEEISIPYGYKIKQEEEKDPIIISEEEKN